MIIGKKEILEYALEYVSDEEERRYNYYMSMKDIKGAEKASEDEWRIWLKRKIELENRLYEMR